MKTMNSSCLRSTFNFRAALRSVLAVTVFALIVAGLSASPVQAQVNITTLNTSYTQNFDLMGTGNLFLTDDGTGGLAGFYAYRDIGNTSPNFVEADNGSGTDGGFKNYGAANQLDRALGVLPDANTGSIKFGLRLVNQSGVPISSFQVRFTGEQWRSGGQTPQDLVFSYRKDTNVNDIVTGTYTVVPALSFTSPALLFIPGPVDGNDPANRVQYVANFAVTMMPGEEIMLKWEMHDELASNHGLAIDDLEITANGGSTAADASIGGRVTDAQGRGIGRTRVMLWGGNLSEPVYALTNAFGYYSFDGVESGASYFLRVESKRYRFNDPVLYINLGDSMTGVDFVASN
jgi:hypothetical protein